MQASGQEEADEKKWEKGSGTKEKSFETVKMGMHRWMNAKCYLKNEARYRKERESKWLFIAHCLCLLLLSTAGIDFSRSNSERAKKQHEAFRL